MSLTRIKGLMLQELYFTSHSVECLFDVLLFPLVNLVLFALLSQYISRSVDGYVVKQLLLGALLWQFMYIVQYSVSVNTMWNLWARNLSNIFITPIRIAEYFTAYATSGGFKALLVTVLSVALLSVLFGFQVLDISLVALGVYLVNLWIFGIGTGIIILGLVFRFGTRISAFSWGFMPMLQPLMATLFPRAILPEPLRSLALVFPPTYIFESARGQLQSGALSWETILFASVGDLIYLVMAVVFFRVLYTKSRETGQFVRNE